jgi:hypothetical protein
MMKTGGFGAGFPGCPRIEERRFATLQPIPSKIVDPFEAQPIRNRVRPEVQEAKTEMTPLRATLLSFAMLSAITFWGIAIYTADAAGNHAVVDGYGVTALTR